MRYGEYIALIEAEADRRGLELAPSAIQAFASQKYLDPGLLGGLDQDEIERSIGIIFADIDDESGDRLRAQQDPIRAAQVRQVLRRYFCSLPPFCRGRKTANARV